MAAEGPGSAPGPDPEPPAAGPAPCAAAPAAEAEAEAAAPAAARQLPYAKKQLLRFLLRAVAVASYAPSTGVPTRPQDNDAVKL
jgi:hypothetical protein